MEESIHPEALKTLRKKRGWSQEDLANRCGCSTEQVSRWERGKSRRLRSFTRENLTRVLGVKWEELTRPPSDNDDSNDPFLDLNLTQLNVRVNRSVRNALQLVCLRYKVTPAEVISAAPLLFLIIAEQSLAHRQKMIDEIYEQVGHMEKKNRTTVPHIATEMVYRGHLVDQAFGSEDDSISQRDIYGNEVVHENATSRDEEDFNPFVNYLKLITESIPNDLVDELSDGFGWPARFSYTLAKGTLREVTGIAGETEEEERILEWITIGFIELREVLSAKENLTGEEYIQHLNKLCDQTREQRQSAWDRKFGASQWE